MQFRPTPEGTFEPTAKTPVGVILAAGTGARLGNGCKPLARVAGIPVEEALLAAPALLAGVTVIAG